MTPLQQFGAQIGAQFAAAAMRGAAAQAMWDPAEVFRDLCRKDWVEGGPFLRQLIGRAICRHGLSFQQYRDALEQVHQQAVRAIHAQTVADGLDSAEMERIIDELGPWRPFSDAAVVERVSGIAEANRAPVDSPASYASLTRQFCAPTPWYRRTWVLIAAPLLAIGGLRYYFARR